MHSTHQARETLNTEKVNINMSDRLLPADLFFKPSNLVINTPALCERVKDGLDRAEKRLDTRLKFITVAMFLLGSFYISNAIQCAISRDPSKTSVVEDAVIFIEGVTGVALSVGSYLFFKAATQKPEQVKEHVLDNYCNHLLAE